MVSVNFDSGSYSLDFIPITNLPKEEYYPLSDRVLLSKDSAVYLEGAELDWSNDLGSFFLVPPSGAVQVSGGGTFTYH
jgi:Fe-S cluster assembly iron-binding protein IscA